MKYALVLAAALLSSTAIAESDDTRLVIHGASHHSHPRPNGGQWNEVNTGIGLRRTQASGLSVQGGFYRNSINRTSAYALLEYTPLHIGAVSAGAFIGAATGYIYPVVPTAGAVMRAEAGRFSLALRYIPRVSINKTSTAALELGVRF